MIAKKEKNTENMTKTENVMKIKQIWKDQTSGQKDRR